MTKQDDAIAGWFRRSDREPPRLLVSVRNVREAEKASRGGASILDVKEPKHGPLGQASDETLEAVIAAGREANLPVTAALGEFEEQPSASRSLPRGLAFAKVGLAGVTANRSTRQRLRSLKAAIASSSSLVLAAYADARRAASPPVMTVFEWAQHLDLPFLLIDTYEKDGSHLWDWLSPRSYSRLWRECESAGIGLALAGSLDVEGLQRCGDRWPDVLAVRGAACRGGQRGLSICRGRVRKLRTSLDAFASGHAVVPTC